jgi:HSP20 family protein
MAEKLPIRQSPSILEDLKALEERITQRAYEIFSTNGIPGRDLENWLQAENEIVWKPAVELCEKGEEFLLEIAVPGVEPVDVDIEVTPEDILLRAEIAHGHHAQQGTVHICEFTGGKMFRSIHLPKRIEPEKVKAEFNNGMLYLTAPISAGSKLRRAKVEAA